MPDININLPNHEAEYVKGKVHSGQYGSADEAIHEGLRLLEEREQEDRAKLDILRREVLKGAEECDRGDFSEQSLDEIAAEARIEYEAWVKAEHKTISSTDYQENRKAV